MRRATLTTTWTWRADRGNPPGRILTVHGYDDIQGKFNIDIKLLVESNENSSSTTFQACSGPMYDPPLSDCQAAKRSVVSE